MSFTETFDELIKTLMKTALRLLLPVATEFKSAVDGYLASRTFSDRSLSDLTDLRTHWCSTIQNTARVLEIRQDSRQK